MTVDSKVAEILESEAANFVSDIRDILVDLETVVESPIEMIMAARLLFIQCGYGYHSRHNIMWAYGSPDEGPGGGLSLREFDIAIVPQWSAGEYRADFLVLLAAPKWRSGGFVVRKFIVECDGHEFHEKTKEQASRDKARDRFFASLGCQVFRYTGSEIFRNSDDLLRDLGAAMTRAIEDGRDI